MANEFELGEMSGSGVRVMELGPAAKEAFVVIRKGIVEYLARASGKLTTEATLSPEQPDRVARAVKDKSAIEENGPGHDPKRGRHRGRALLDHFGILRDPLGGMIGVIRLASV
jgi:hypothetical protein